MAEVKLDPRRDHAPVNDIVRSRKVVKLDRINYCAEVTWSEMT
jgi:hypothetical protein